MIVQLNRILLYAKEVEATANFYSKHFGFTIQREDGDRIVELVAPNGGMTLMLHPAGRRRKEGQTSIKLVFDVEDVSAFCEHCRKHGLEFGPLHRADGYIFANAKDPSKNLISVSSRAFRAQV